MTDGKRPDDTVAPHDGSPAGEFARMRPWGAFLYRDYRILWGAAFTATVVVWLRILSTAQWLLDETGSAALVGLIGVVQLLVQVPALLWGGSLADRIDRKQLIVIANSLTFGTMLGLGLLDASGMLTPGIVYGGIAITAASQMLANPARAALVPAVVPERHLMLAVSTDTASQNIAAIAGPLLFALVALTAGLTAAFFVAAAISLPSVLLPLLIRAGGRAVGGRRGSTLSQIWEGFWYTVRHPILPGLFLLDTGITVVSFYREILPVLARGLFRGGASATGILGAANSAGAVGGAFLALFLSGYRAKGMLVLYATLAYALILLGFGTVTTLWLGAVMIAGLGAADAVTVAVRQATVMLTTPDHMRGRAVSFMILAAQTANNIGTIWVGLWAAVIGASNTMVLGSAISLVATLLIWRLWRPIREYRSP
jgi:predicted MFS family arabinose efflux permease